MSGTSSAMVRVRPDSERLGGRVGHVAELARRPRSTCSRVRWLTRCGREKARDTVEVATPAASATSARVGRRLGRGTHAATIWQEMANACHVTGATPSVPGTRHDRDGKRPVATGAGHR